jgi:hypothetical protein
MERSSFGTKTSILTDAGPNSFLPCTKTYAGWVFHGVKARIAAVRTLLIRKVNGANFI